MNLFTQHGNAVDTSDLVELPDFNSLTNPQKDIVGNATWFAISPNSPKGVLMCSRSLLNKAGLADLVDEECGVEFKASDILLEIPVILHRGNKVDNWYSN